jgi:hypothetical protein
VSDIARLDQLEGYDVLWVSKADLGIWESLAFMRDRSSFLAAFKACGVDIMGCSGGSGVEEGGIDTFSMFTRGYNIICFNIFAKLRRKPFF